MSILILSEKYVDVKSLELYKVAYFIHYYLLIIKK